MFAARFEWSEPIASKNGKILQDIKFGDTPNKWKINRRLGSEGNDYWVVTLDIPIVDDFSFDLASSFQSKADVLQELPLLGSISNLFQTINKITAASQGTISKSNEIYKMQVWENTDPFRMNLRAVLNTETDPYTDVWLPAMLLSSQTIFSIVNGAIHTPGINDRAFKSTIQKNEQSSETNTGGSGKDPGKDVSKEQQKKLLEDTPSKIIEKFSIVTTNALNESVTLLEIGIAIISKAKPEFSKEQTESGYPLWCELDLEVQSAFSANDDMFNFEKRSKATFKALAKKTGRSITGNFFR